MQSARCPRKHNKHSMVVILKPNVTVLKFIQCVISDCEISFLSSENHFGNSNTSNTKITMHDHKNKNYLITNYITDITQTAVLLNITYKISG